MESGAAGAANSNGAIWTGRILSTLVVLLLVFDAILKFIQPAPPAVVEAFDHLGLPLHLSLVLATVLSICSLLYAIPRTCVLGAILLTGYLGGAVATHLRAGDPIFSRVLFPAYIGVLLWLGLYLREARLRTLIPLRN